MSRNFHSVDVIDVFEYSNDKVSWKSYSNTWDDNAAVVESILLFPEITARTNVMIRGRDGKLISYRDLADENVKAAVELLAPFPVRGH